MRITKYLIVAAALSTTACEDPFASTDWDPTPLEVTLYSASRPEYVGRTSGFDLATSPPRAVAIETESGAGSWDVLLIEQGNGLALAPAGVFSGVVSRSAIATMTNVAFADVRRAPGDDAFTEDPVPLQMNVVYIIKSRPTGCTLTTGPIYAKIQPVEVNAATGVFRFNYVDNPNCGDRDLVPED